MNRGIYKPSSAQRLQTQTEYDKRCCLATDRYARCVDADFCDGEGRSALHLTLLRGHGEGTEHALRAGCDVNAEDTLGRRPIHYAAERGLVLCTRRLIAYGAQLNTLNQKGQSALMTAADRGHVEVMRMLIKAGAMVNMKNEKGETALHFAAASSRRPGEVDGLSKRDKDGSAKAKDLDVIDVLIKAKANVNAVDSFGRSALHHAAQANWCDCVLRLFDAKADLDKADVDGDTAFVVAIKANCPSALQVLIDLGCERSCMIGDGEMMGTGVTLAAVRGHTDVLGVFLSSGEGPDEGHYVGMTPLMLAAFESHVDTVERLLRSGADPNRCGRTGATALHRSLMMMTSSNDRRRHDVIVRLVRAGADVNKRVSRSTSVCFTSCTDGRNCPLSFALSSGYVSLVRLLLIAGCEVSSDECRSWTQLNDIHGFYKDALPVLGPISIWTRQPRTLKHLCRSVIRSSIGSSRVGSAVGSLPIATPLKRYLHFEELDGFGVERVDVSDRANPGSFETLRITDRALRSIEGTLTHHAITNGWSDIWR